MRTGSLLEVAGVVKSMIAMPSRVEESKIEKLLAVALAKCSLRFPDTSEFQA